MIMMWAGFIECSGTNVSDSCLFYLGESFFTLRTVRLNKNQSKEREEKKQ